jgi:RNA-directed DNA polymerase
MYRYLWNPFLLSDALDGVLKNGGAPGIDKQSVKEVKARRWEFVKELSTELKAGTYQPSATRRVYIPKAGKGLRPLGIPTIKDRVVQRALCFLLEGIYEQRFHNFSFGFRPGRKAVDCAAVVAKEVYRHRQVLEADIASFFDQVKHNKLLKLLEREIVDPRVLRLISKFLKSGSMEIGKPWEPSKEGTPQGGPLSPLLANVYLHHYLDEKFKEVFSRRSGIKLFRFADDFVIVAKWRKDIETARRFLTGWMEEAGLRLKQEKTRLVDMSNEKRSHESCFDFLGFHYHLRSYKDNPKRFWIARQASRKSRHKLRDRLKEVSPAHHALGQTKHEMLAVWRGWNNYFRYSNNNRVVYRECDSIRRILWRYLRRKFRRGKRPAAWIKLRKLHKALRQGFKPIRVIPDHLTYQGQQLAF